MIFMFQFHQNFTVCASSVEHNADVLKGIEERQEDFPEQQCIFFKAICCYPVDKY